MKILIFFINTIYWIWLVITPLIPATILGIWLYDRSIDNVPYIVAIGIVSLILGIILAEYVRKGQGLTTFFSTIMNSGNIPDKSQKNQNEVK